MVNAATVDARQERGLALLRSQKAKIRHIAGAKYQVPSATGAGAYVVDLDDRQCTCPDHQERAVRCKHMWAVSYFREEVAMPDGSTVVTETVKAVRLTYSQDWTTYNAAQTEEKARARVLLAALCDGIAEPPRTGPKGGRPRLPLRDTVYGAAWKVYVGMSGRRSTTDIDDCRAAGFISVLPSYNTLFRFVESEESTPLLSRLVDESARPLAPLETDPVFAADATGFATTTHDRWFDFRYGNGDPVVKSRRRFVKLHAMVGTSTHIITAARVTDKDANDCPEFPALVQQTAANGFRAKEIVADKGYLSRQNAEAVEAVGARPFIAFKSNSVANAKSAAWDRMFHHFAANRDDYLAHYHARSNVETVFSSLKRKFGAAVRSELHAAQVNEVLLKCVCHNISRLVHAIHELNVDPKFWAPRDVPRLRVGT
jgi:transposase